jgi:hypothetical protein
MDRIVLKERKPKIQIIIKTNMIKDAAIQCAWKL